MSYEINGKILHVDLTAGRTWTEPVSRELTRKYIGCRGVNAKLLWDNFKPGTEALSPSAPLIFGTGPLTGTEAPNSGRVSVTCKSPTTNFYLKTSAGGSWGAELRFAGYSHILVTGKAKKPSYLWIDDDKVEIRDAAGIWGKDIRETDLGIKKDLHDEDVQVACIGPAGEHLVVFASIMFSVYHAAGRGGAGAVMGSKNLKAIAVRGTGYIKAAQPEAFHQAALMAKAGLKAESGFDGFTEFGTSGSMAPINEIHGATGYNYQKQALPDVSKITGAALIDGGFLKRRVACFSCLIGCHRYTEIGQGPWAGSYAAGPELETLNALGLNVGIFNTEGALKANELANIYGMDTISLGGVIGWAMECWQRGVFTEKDTGGLDLSWGNEETVNKLIRMIALREGLGDLLADGTKRAAEKTGQDSYKWAVQAKGLEQSRVDTRNGKGYALAFAVNPRGPDHLMTETFAEFGFSPEGNVIITKVTGDVKYANPYLTEKRAEIVLWHEDIYALTEALGCCVFISTALFGILDDKMAEMFSAAIGEKVTAEEAMEIGRRIVTLEKCFNIREGATRNDDKLPWRMMYERPTRPKGMGTANSPEELGEMLDRYYELHHWDKVTSWPTRAELERLDLKEVAKELSAAGKLPKEGRPVTAKPAAARPRAVKPKAAAKRK